MLFSFDFTLRHTYNRQRLPKCSLHIRCKNFNKLSSREFLLQLPSCFESYYRMGRVCSEETDHSQLRTLCSVRRHAGNPSTKYELRRTSALLLRNIRNIRICMGKKTYRFCNLRKWKDSIKKLTLLKMCVASLLCGPRADLWPFYGFLCKRFSLYSVSI